MTCRAELADLMHVLLRMNCACMTWVVGGAMTIALCGCATTATKRQASAHDAVAEADVAGKTLRCADMPLAAPTHSGGETLELLVACWSEDVRAGAINPPGDRVPDANGAASAEAAAANTEGDRRLCQELSFVATRVAARPGACAQ